MDAPRVLEGLDGRPEPVDPCLAGRDPCVVETDGLASVVEDFVSDYVQKHPVSRAPRRDATTGHFSIGGRLAEGAPRALDALSERTRQQDPAGLGVPASTIRNVVERRYQTVELRTADRLVVAAGALASYRDGTLHVKPNPRVKAGEKARCCGDLSGSSLNGSLSNRR